MKTKKAIMAAFIFMLVICIFIPASLAADDIEFTAALTAEDTWIPPNGIVDFTVEIKNTGSVDIDRFEIITPDSILVAEYGALPAGQSASVAIHPIDFHNPGEYPVELFVVGYCGDNSLTKHTDELIITVSNDPEPSPTPEQTPTPTPSPEPTPEPTETATAMPSPSAEPSAEDAAGAGANNIPENDNTLLYIIIAVLGVLAVGIIIAVIVVAARRSKM